MTQTVYLPIFTVITNAKGEPFKERNPNATTPENQMRDITLATVLTHVLDNRFKGEEDLKATEVDYFWTLIKVIAEAEGSFKPAGVSLSDISLLKSRTHKAMFTTQMYGRVIEILDASVEKSKEKPSKV